MRIPKFKTGDTVCLIPWDNVEETIGIPQQIWDDLHDIPLTVKMVDTASHHQESDGKTVYSVYYSLEEGMGYTFMEEHFFVPRPYAFLTDKDFEI